MTPLEALAIALDCPAGGPPLDADPIDRQGWCYALALRTFVERPQGLALGDSDTLTLVHGFPRLQVADRALYGHGWVEVERVLRMPEDLQGDWPDTLASVWCIDPIVDHALPREVYYRLGCIDPQHCRRWSDPQAVLATLLEDGNIGNWAPEDGLPEEPQWLDGP